MSGAWSGVDDFCLCEIVVSTFQYGYSEKEQENEIYLFAAGRSATSTSAVENRQIGRVKLEFHHKPILRGSHHFKRHVDINRVRTPVFPFVGWKQIFTPAITLKYYQDCWH